MGLRTSIFDGIVVHSRLIPKKHNFKYRVFSILFNIDDLKTISKKIYFSHIISLIYFLFSIKTMVKKMAQTLGSGF